MLLGIWKNVEELEDSLCLPELEAMLEASREREHRHHKFLAALKGIDIDDNKSDAKEKFDEVQRRVNARLSGESVEAIEFSDVGIDFEE